MKSKARKGHNAHIINTANQTGGDHLLSEHLVSAVLSEALAMTTINDSFNNIDNELVTLDEVISPSMDPTSYNEAMRSPNQAQWKAATIAEWKSLLQNNIFQVFGEQVLPDLDSSTIDVSKLIPVQLPFGTKAIGSK